VFVIEVDVVKDVDTSTISGISKDASIVTSTPMVEASGQIISNLFNLIKMCHELVVVTLVSALKPFWESIVTCPFVPVTLPLDSDSWV